MRYQTGHIYETKNGFYVRYYRTGQQVSERLCGKDDRHYSVGCKAVRMLADEFMAGVNQGTKGTSNITVVEFFDKTYWPFAQENLRHSTIYAYNHVWKRHLSAHFGKLTLSEYRTHHGSAFLTKLAKTLQRSTVQHIRSLASAIFAHAVNTGLIESNPWRDVKILGKTLPAPGTPHYTLEEIENMITALVDHPEAQAALALACFVGLRPSEIQGLHWDDIEGDQIHIRRAIVRGKEGPPKTAGSTASLPLVRPVRLALSAWRAVSPDPERIFRRNLKTTSTCVIRPVLAAKNLRWAGLYAGRRGAATLLVQLTGNAVAASQLLRHTDLSMTTKKYVKDMPEALGEGMRLLEAKVAK